MYLSHGEQIKYIIKRHKTPLYFRLFFIVIALTPIFIFLYALSKVISTFLIFAISLILITILAAVIGLLVMNYAFDKLIITDKRVIYEDWHSPFARIHNDAPFHEIQDIRTREKGILAAFRIFDYGIISIETAASTRSIDFDQCPDPEGVKQQISEEMTHMHERTHGLIQNTYPKVQTSDIMHA